jgi:hypothetical protein
MSKLVMVILNHCHKPCHVGIRNKACFLPILLILGSIRFNLKNVLKFCCYITEGTLRLQYKNTKRLTLFPETFAICYENHNKPINILWGEK